LSSPLSSHLLYEANDAFSLKSVAASETRSDKEKTSSISSIIDDGGCCGTLTTGSVVMMASPC